MECNGLERNPTTSWIIPDDNSTKEILPIVGNNYNKTFGCFHQYKYGNLIKLIINCTNTNEYLNKNITFAWGFERFTTVLSAVTCTSTPSSANITTPSGPSTELIVGLSVGLPCTCLLLACLVYCICKKKHKRCIDMLNCKKCRPYELTDSCDNCATDKEMDVSPKEHDELSDSEAPKQNGICNSDEPEEYTQNIHDHPVRQKRMTKYMQPKQDGPSKVIPSGN